MTNQVAITMLKNLEQSLDDYCELNDEGKEAFHMAITALELFGNSEQLPSTHSKLEKNSQKLDNENGELISRQEVIAEFSCCELTPDGGIDANYAIDFLEQLPPVQSRKGKWIGYNADDKDWQRDDGSPIFMNCSECHEAVINNGSAHWNFCPNCGCRMEEGDSE